MNVKFSDRLSSSDAIPETEKSQRESEVNELRAKIESVEKRMDNFKPPGIGGDEDDETARQIIARGFDRDIDVADIIKTF